MVHPWDAPLSDDEWRAWLADGHDFGTLIAAGRGRDLPVVVPTHFAFDGASTVVLHLARPNPLWAAVAENPHVVLSVVGDAVYVPAAWKDDDPAQGVPTSYYAAVQLSGPATVLDGADALRAQLPQFDPDLPDPGVVHARRMRGIRGLRIDVMDVRAKFKFGGNADDAGRARVARGLAERGGPGDAAARAHLLRRGGTLGA